MERKLSARIRSRVGVAAVGALRRAGRTRIGERLGIAWYRRRARLLAAELVRLRGIEGVYLSGTTESATSGPIADVSAVRRVALGYSDIDLVLVTNLPTLNDELRLRGELVSVVRRHNRPLQLFQHMDYVEARDVELLQRLGHAYVLRQSSWQHLAGHDHRRPGVAPTERHRELAAAAESVGHWVKGSNLVLRPWPQMGAFERLRHGRRFLSGFISNWLDLDRNLPLSNLLEAARARAPGEAFRALARDPYMLDSDHPAGPMTEVVSASLEVLDAHVTRVCHGFSGTWPSVLSPPPRLEWPDIDPAITAALRTSHFASLEVVLRAPGPREHVALLTAAPHVPATQVVAHLQTLFGRIEPFPQATFDRATLPVLFTPALRRAAALLEPFPLAGISLGAGAAWAHPQGIEAPPAPAAADFAALVRISSVQLLARARGTALRFLRKREQTMPKMAREILLLAPMLDALYEGRPIDFSLAALDTEQEDETELLARLRHFLEDLRPRLQRDL